MRYTDVCQRAQARSLRMKSSVNYLNVLQKSKSLLYEQSGQMCTAMMIEGQQHNLCQL